MSLYVELQFIILCQKLISAQWKNEMMTQKYIDMYRKNVKCWVEYQTDV